MSDDLRLLVLEDSATDCELMTRTLARAGWEVSHERVDSAPGFIAALGKADWDAILADYNVPGFGAPAALDILNGQKADIPFIVVSGAIGETRATELMRAGARDYVMKDNLDRLPVVLRRELGEAARRKAHRSSQALHEAAIRSAMDGYLVVDAEGRLLDANDALCEITGRSREQLLGLRIPDLVETAEPNSLAVRFAAIAAEGRQRFECRWHRPDGTHVDVEVSAAKGPRGEVLAFVHDMTERLHQHAQIVLQAGNLERALLGSLNAVSAMVDLRDPYTAGHERRVGDLAAAIGAEMGLAASIVQGLRLTGIVHDIGKIGLPAEILSKPARLTNLEYELVKTHAQAGHDVLKDIVFPWPVAQVILQHHERIDGTGYPAGLAGDEILLEARIMAVADVVEAMASHRPYRASLGLEPALGEIGQGRGRVYDAAAVDACLRLFRDRGYRLPVVT